MSDQKEGFFFKKNKEIQHMSTQEYDFGLFYKRWSLIHSLINVFGLGIALFANLSEVWIGASFLSLLVYVSFISSFLKNRNFRFGVPNCITLIRLVCLIALALFFPIITDLILFGCFVILTSLDGLDGFFARKLGQSSEVGEQFDMETDAFLVLVLSWIHVANETVGWWLLIAGSLRYTYEVISRFVSASSEKRELPKKVRATIAVIFFISLLMPFVFNKEVSSLFLAISSIFIFISFGFPHLKLKFLVQ